MSKTGPVLDQSLSTYKQGLTFIDVRAGEREQGLRERGLRERGG